jgi:hypothetical protein
LPPSKKDESVEDVSQISGLSNIIEKADIAYMHGSTAYLPTSSSKVQTKNEMEASPKYILLPQSLLPHKVHILSESFVAPL